MNGPHEMPGASQDDPDEPSQKANPEPDRDEGDPDDATRELFLADTLPPEEALALSSGPKPASAQAPANAPEAGQQMRNSDTILPPTADATGLGSQADIETLPPPADVKTVPPPPADVETVPPPPADVETIPPPAESTTAPQRPSNQRKTPDQLEELQTSKTLVSRAPTPGSHKGPRTYTDGGTDEGTDRGTDGDTDADSPIRPGMAFAHYELIRELGRGGMGAVYLARDVRLGRRVAVKFVHSKDSAMGARFLAEARVTAHCKHDSIVQIYDLGEAHGYPYMVLEFLEGVTLRAWMQSRWAGARADDLAPGDAPVSPTLAVEMVAPVVRGLSRAHGLGLVHRDLKPENIMLTDDGAIKVLDFGIATVRAEPSVQFTDDFAKNWSHRGFETMEGELVGTIPYMSPEQCRAEEVDQRSDIWAVGVMLWELCTGYHPLSPLTYKVLQGMPSLDVPMPSMGEKYPHLGALAAVVDRCLKKPRDERFGSAQDLLEALEALQLGRDQHAPAADADREPDNPYVGLAVFQEHDSGRFFGRERDISSTVTRLRNHRMVTVAGASGAGKSSFVRAGLIPALARSGQKWDWYIARPGRQPLGALAGVLERIARDSGETLPELSAADDRSAIADALREQHGYLGAFLRARCRDRNSKAVLFIDQFEELYTTGSDRDTREAFVRILEGVADDASSPLRVVLSVRSDFLDRVAEDRAFTSELTRSLMLLPSMGRDQLEQALNRPLQAVGYDFENREQLVATMLDALEATRAPLPLLQFTAARLWETRDTDRKLISQASYDALGGVAGALATHADSVLAGLSVSQQRLARTVFANLVSDERTRAIVSLDELRAHVPDDAREELERVVQQLVDARLVLMETDVEVGGSTVELSHESLITRWETLARWLSEDQDAAQFRARLHGAAREWDRHGRTDDLLWRGHAALTARHWLERWQEPDDSLGSSQLGAGQLGGLGQLDLGSRDEDFLKAVVALATRSRRRRLLIMGAFAVLLATALVILFLALQAQKQSELAERQSVRADRAAALARQEANRADQEAARARNAGRIAVAREKLSDPTLTLAVVRGLEETVGERGEVVDLPPRWQQLAHWAIYEGVAEVVFDRPDSLFFAAFNRAGDRVVLSLWNGTAEVWNVDGTGQPVVLEGHQDRVASAVFSPDGRRILTASHDKTARVWDADGRGELIKLTGHEGRVFFATFSKDGARVVTASSDRTARIWNADGSGQPTVLEGHDDRVYAAAFSPDGAYVVTASADRTARLWNADGSGQVRIFKGHEDRVMWVAFSPDGERIVTASADRTARIWNTDGTGEPDLLKGHQRTVMSAEFSPDGKRVVTASEDHTAQVWSLSASASEGARLRGHQDYIRTAVWSADGKRIITASYDKTARVWDIAGSRQPQILRGHRAPVTAGEFSLDGRRIVTSSQDRTARVWHVDGVREPTVLEGHSDVVNSAAFSPDGRRVVTASDDNTARVWNADGSGQPKTLAGHTDRVNTAVFDPTGALILTASSDESARLWDADTAVQKWVFTDHKDELSAVAFSPDGKRIATASYDQTVRIQNADGTGDMRVFEQHKDIVNAVAFSPDGKRLLTATANLVLVWDVEHPRAPKRTLKHDQLVYLNHTGGTGTFSRDGSLVVTATLDKRVYLWNIDSREEPVILQAPDLTARNVTFDPAGGRIMSMSHQLMSLSKGNEFDYAVKLWPLAGRFAGLDDPMLWRATTYCPSVALRMDLLHIPESTARRNFEDCQRRVAGVRARP